MSVNLQDINYKNKNVNLSFEEGQKFNITMEINPNCKEKDSIIIKNNLNDVICDIDLIHY